MVNNAEQRELAELVTAFHGLRKRALRLVDEAEAVQDIRACVVLTQGVLPKITKTIAALNEYGADAVPALRRDYVLFDDKLRELEVVFGAPDERTMLVTPDGRWIELTPGMRRIPTGHRIAGVEIDGVTYAVVDGSVVPDGDGTMRMLRLIEFGPPDN